MVVALGCSAAIVALAQTSPPLRLLDGMLVLDLGKDGATPHLRRASPQEAPPPPDPIEDRLLRLLRAATDPVSRVALRRQLAVKNLHLGHALAALEEDRLIHRTPTGWTVSPTSPPPSP